MKKEFECNKCGYKWKGRVEKDLINCPRCKRYDWNKKEKKTK